MRFLILALVVGFGANAQYPVQRNRVDSPLTPIPNTLTCTLPVILHFSDTCDANKSSVSKHNGSIIIIKNKLWIRSKNKWVKIQ